MLRMRFAEHLNRFKGDASGAVLIFIVVLMPLVLLIGGIATDVSMANAQRRYTQWQADLAALGGARHLPDPVATRNVARQIVQLNDYYGRITLPDANIVLGTYVRGGGFTADLDQANPSSPNAVRVLVPSPFDPFLLTPILAGRDLTIQRHAVATRRGSGGGGGGAGDGGDGGIAVFTLRNRLIGLNTSQSILNVLTGPLGLGLTANVLNYEGLVNTRLGLDDLLGLATLGLAAEVETFDDVLKLPVALPQLLGGLVGIGGLPPTAVPPGGMAQDTVTLDQIMAMSPGLLNLNIGDVLPDVSVNALDTLTALAALAARKHERLAVGAGLDLSPLVNTKLDIGLIRPPVTAIAVDDDIPGPYAEVAQTNVALTAEAAGLITLSAHVELGNARAELLSLDCSATEPTDVIATFGVETAAGGLALEVGLLDSRPAIAPRDLDLIPIAANTRVVPVTLADVGKPIPIPNPISTAGLATSVNSALKELRNDLQVKRSQCSGFLGAVLCAVLIPVFGVLSALLDLLTSMIDGLTNLIANIALLENLVQALLDTLGIRLAQADLILDSFACGGSEVVLVE